MRAFHRRLLVVYGRESEDVLVYILSKHRALKNGEEEKVIYVGPEEISNYEILVKRLEEKSYPIGNVKFYAFKETHRLMGTTNDVLILDMSLGARPNDVGRLIETVKGGGLVILYNLNLNVEKPWSTSLHKKLISPPYCESDIKMRFEKYFIRKILEDQSIWILDGWNIVRGNLLNPPTTLREKPSPPKRSRIPKVIYDLALTQDQIDSLECIERFARKNRSIIVMTSNRGRGKSALLGLAVVPLMLFGARRILVTAPACEETQVVFDMAEKALKTIGEEVEKEHSENLTFRLSCNKGILEFIQPYRLLKEKADVVLVDEAAGIQVPLLFEIAKKFPKVIFASTVHGYEGAGRGFSLRFLKRLEKIDGIILYKIELKEPIRYALDDPVEKWLYDTLLLNAEPAEVEESEVKLDDCTYVKPDLDLWFGEDEEHLRQFIGIYVLAHYRNRPDDLLILGDAPHHSARAVLSASGKVLVALQVSEEGCVDIVEDVLTGVPPPGHLIPSCIIKYYPHYAEFSKLKGLRVVRIATHPEFMGKGLGSLAIEELCAEAEANGFEWIGASFGADVKLINFWLKNGFIPVHISPMRNMVSGEFSVIFVKPLTEKSGEIVRVVHREFKLRLIESLPDIYFDLEPMIVARLLKSQKWNVREKPYLTNSQKNRLLQYTSGTLAYEGACDAIKQFVKSHFLSSGDARINLSLDVEAKLITKCLQAKPWRHVAKIFQTPQSTLKTELRTYIGKMVDYYEIQTAEFQERI